MARYIDAEQFECISWKGIPEGYDDTFDSGVLWLADLIDDAPTISPDEVLGVVHCRECKFWRRPPSCEGLARCETGETGIRYRSKNDFCSRGAKMEVSEDA